MQNQNDNIDLDALFDMLNIVQGRPDVSPDAASVISAQADQAAYEIQDLSPIGADFFIMDLSSDQS
jgi:hypothetical protein